MSEICVHCGAHIDPVIDYCDMPFKSFEGAVLKNIQTLTCPECESVEYVYPKIEDLIDKVQELKALGVSGQINLTFSLLENTWKRC